MQPISTHMQVLEHNDLYDILTFQFKQQTYRVDAGGTYEQLTALPLALIRPFEVGQSQSKIARYAAMFRAGSPFPPIDVVGLWPGRDYYRIVNGHHRYEAAKLCGCETIPAWTDFSVPVPGLDCYRPARLPDTEGGRRIAAHLGWQWCPDCLSLLDFDPATGHCHKCELDRAALAMEAT